jgi:hypothetical protein
MYQVILATVDRARHSEPGRPSAYLFHLVWQTIHPVECVESVIEPVLNIDSAMAFDTVALNNG